MNETESYEARWGYDRVPNADYMAHGVEMYVEHGQPPGNFLQAVFANDLMEAFGRADLQNRAAMFDWASWIYNASIPGSCHGSWEAVKAWISHDGKEGWQKAREEAARIETEEFEDGIG